MDNRTLAERQEAYARGYAKAQAESARAIRLLADAVELSGEWFEGHWHSSGCGWWNAEPTPCDRYCIQRREALRLAKRLP